METSLPYPQNRKRSARGGIRWAIPRQQSCCSFKDFIKFLKMAATGALIKGKAVADFESKFARLYGVKHALAAGSCRSVFSLALDAMDIKAGDEVILPAFNLPAFPKILLHKEIIPIFVDIDATTLNINPELIEENITPRTKAIVAVHLFGNSCDIERIAEIARKHKLYLIEDCANAHLTRHNDRLLGTFGDAACFSLSHTKDIPTFGGGILLTNNTQLFARAKEVLNAKYKTPRIFGMWKMFIKNLILKILSNRIVFSILFYPLYLIHKMCGTDLVACLIEEKDVKLKRPCCKKYTNFQAGVGIDRLADQNRQQEKRVHNAKKLCQALQSAGHIRLPQSPEHSTHAYWRYVCMTEERTRRIDKLNSMGIDAKSLAAYDCNSYNIFKAYKRNCPYSEKVAEKAVMLPLYHYLNESDVHYMAKAIKHAV